jgi:hypothetical protein
MRRFHRQLPEVSAAEALRLARAELAQMDKDQQVDELLILQDDLASQEAPRAGTGRRRAGSDSTTRRRSGP